jgi:hypothetical protein
MRSICGDPLFGWIAEKVFRRPRVSATSTRLPGSIAAKLPGATLVLKAFAGRGYNGLKRKGRGYLVQSGGRLHFAMLRFFRSPLIVELPLDGHTVTVDTGILSNSVDFLDDSGERTMRVRFTRRYNAVVDSIRDLLSAGGTGEVASGRRERVIDIGRSLGAAVKGESRATLRAELA